jgi:predicted CoA-binding protein
MTSRKTIDGFLGLKRIAVVGVSRDPKDFTRSLFRELCKRGYEAIPVNPGAGDIDGVRAVPSVAQAYGAEGALLLTNAGITNEIVRECEQAGIRNVWMYRATGAGAVNSYAVEFCKEQGIDVVEGECPFMFLESPGFPHNVHGWCRRIVGKWPK